MSSKIAINIITATIGLILLSACGETSTAPGDRYQVDMEAYNLSLIEAKAFQTCQSQMRKADFKPRTGVTMTRVPAKICACHAPMMVKHFTPGKGSEHSLVLAYVAGSSKNTSLNPNSLIDPSQPRKQFMALARSLNSCAKTVAQDNSNATKSKMEELCEQGKLDAKRCEKILADLK